METGSVVKMGKTEKTYNENDISISLSAEIVLANPKLYLRKSGDLELSKQN